MTTRTKLAEDTPTAPPLPAGHHYLLGIGVDAYQHFPPLPNAGKDARDVCSFLQEHYHFDPERSTLLIGPDASRRNILRCLNDYRRQLTPDDCLLIYYAGHGLFDTGLGFWIPAEAARDDLSDWVSNADVREIIRNIRARHILLISDSCFSASLLVRDGTRDVSSRAFDDFDRHPSRWVFISGRGVVSDGRAGENSPFAAGILKTLRHNVEPALNIARLADQVTKDVRFNYEQHAEASPLFQAGHEGGQFLFRRRAVEADAWAEALRLGTEGSLLTFLSRYPDGQHTAEAEQRLADLADNRAWEKAARHDSAITYRHYLRDYPTGRHTAGAQAKIAALVAEENDRREAEQRRQQAEREAALQTLREKESQERTERERREQQAREAALRAQRELEQQALREKEAQERTERERREQQAREAALRAQRELEQQALREKEAQERAERERREQQVREAALRAQRELELQTLREKEAQERAERERREQQARTPAEQQQQEFSAPKKSRPWLIPGSIAAGLALAVGIYAALPEKETPPALDAPAVTENSVSPPPAPPVDTLVLKPLTSETPTDKKPEAQKPLTPTITTNKPTAKPPDKPSAAELQRQEAERRERERQETERRRTEEINRAKSAAKTNVQSAVAHLAAEEPVQAKADLDKALNLGALPDNYKDILRSAKAHITAEEYAVAKRELKALTNNL